jgi:hypothetical protein
MLRTELDADIEAGRFEAARSRYLELVHVWRESKNAEPAAFLAALDPSMFFQPVERVLSGWLRFSTQYILDQGQRRRAWRGLVNRLRLSTAVRPLVAASPDCLTPVANALWELAVDAPDAAVEARDLVRDALAEGHELCPSDFLDPAVRDLLSENLGPIWLASLGVIRHVWAGPAIDDDEASTLLQRHGYAAPDDAEAARQFWDCLRIARSPCMQDALRQDARRRMKRLNPELHGLALANPTPKGSSPLRSPVG